jgi:hypothetical protein
LLTVAAAIGLLAIVVLVIALYSGLGQNPGSALADWMLDAGGGRKTLYRPLRAAAFAALAIGLCFFIWFIPRGHVARTAVHGEHVAGVIALGCFGVSAILFVIWWLLAGRRVRGD